MSTSNQLGRRHRVVVIGSGFGGLFATKALKRAPVDVTMISRTSHHLFQPLLYQVATGILSEGEIAPATREILRKQDNVRVLLGDVASIDLDARTVTSAAEHLTTVTPYDSLIVAAGASTSYFGHEEWSAVAPGLKSIDDALEVRARIFNAFEFAELETDLALRNEWMTFVVVGAGPTGVELAGQIAELSQRTLRRNYRDIDTSQSKVVLLDAMGSVLGSFGSKLGAAAAERLAEMGVEVWLNARVVGADARGLDLEDEHGVHDRIPTRTAIWAAGVRASSLGQQLGEQTAATVDRSGRVEVEDDLSLPGHPEVFVIGDMMSLKGYPGVSQLAMQGGRYAAEQIQRGLAGRQRKEAFEYFDKGSMATISRFNAVAQIGRFRFSGFIAWLLWLGVHLFYLIGFKNRVSTLMHWFVTFVGRGRSEQTRTRREFIAPPLPSPSALVDVEDEPEAATKPPPRVLSTGS